MPLITVRPTSAGRRHQTRLVQSEVTTDNSPLKSQLRVRLSHAGRNNTGKITVRHHGGGHKRQLRMIDFKRNKFDIPGKVVSIEYDPNRGANLARIHYADGDRRYILAPVGLFVGDQVISAKLGEPKVGNCLPLKAIPEGTLIHNLEMRPGKGGQLVRGAGTSALIQSKEDKLAIVVLPSKEVRKLDLNCMATIGQVGNIEYGNVKVGKAGRNRHWGIRPSVRGVAMHPGAHPHGGGEGRSGIGMPSPKSPWGKKTLGKKTRIGKKYSNQYIIKGRKR